VLGAGERSAREVAPSVSRLACFTGQRRRSLPLPRARRRERDEILACVPKPVRVGRLGGR
jgi:hypothetical protein